MDEAVNQLLSTSAMILGLAAFVGSFFVRRIVETAIPTARKQADANDPKITYLTPFSRWWNEVILYALPAVMGGSCAASKLVPGVGVHGSTVSGQALFGIIVGFFSGFMYKVLRKLVKKSTGVDLDPMPGGSIPPVDSAPPPATAS